MYKVYKSGDINYGKAKPIDFKDLESQMIEKIDDESEDTEKESINKESIEEEIESKNTELLELEEIIAKKRKESENIIKEAELEKENIIKKAKEEKDHIFNRAKKEGYDDGFLEGEKEGEIKAYKERTKYIDEAKNLKKKGFEYKSLLIKKLEPEIIDLIIDIADRIIKREVEKDNELLLNLIETGLAKISNVNKLKVRVSKEDFEILDEKKNYIYMMTEGIEDIDVKIDHSFKKNQISIESESGNVDVSLDTQIKKVEESFKELLKSE